MFCGNCGQARKADNEYCPHCGIPFLSQPSVAVGTASAQAGELQLRTTPYFPEALPLSRKGVERSYRNVKVELYVLIDRPAYEWVSWAKAVPEMLLTEGSILFLDRKGSMRPWKKRIVRPYVVPETVEVDQQGRPVPRGFTPVPGTTTLRPVSRFGISISRPIYIGKFWTLRRSVNEELYQEFRRNPKAYPKLRGALRPAWWVRGYREWMWVESILYAEGSRCVEFRLSKVQALAQMGGGRQAPSFHPGYQARVFLESAGHAMGLKNYLDNVAKPDLGLAFSPEYIACLPVIPPSTLALAYYYVSWTAAAGAVLLGILLGLSTPLWVTVLVELAGCLVVVQLLRRWHRRLKSQAEAVKPPAPPPP